MKNLIKKLLIRLDPRPYNLSPNSPLQPNSGFTFVEVVVMMGVALILFGLTTTSLLNTQHQVSLDLTVDEFIADLKEQQIKAMIGDTEGRTATDTHGVYFTTNSYTVFHGTYSSGESSNFTVTLPESLRFSIINLPGSQIVFEQGSGEIAGFVNGQNTVTLLDAAGGMNKTVTVNKYGVITGVN